MNLGRRVKTPGWHRAHQAAATEQLHPHTQCRVAAAAGLSPNAFTDLPLHQQHQAGVGVDQRTVEPAYQNLKQWTGDVVRDVGDDLVRRGQVEPQNVTTEQVETGLARKAALQTADQIPIQFDRMHGQRRRGQQLGRQGTPARTHLKHPVTGSKRRSGNDRGQHLLIDQPMLAKPLARPVE